MVSSLHQELKDETFFQKNSFFDLLFKTLDEIDGFRNKNNSMGKCNVYIKRHKTCIQFLYDLGFLDQTHRKDDSGCNCLKISSKGSKFLKDYQYLKNLVF